MSTIVALVGPIEFWWDSEEDPQRFNSYLAQHYRHHRDIVNDYLVKEGFLVFRPHEAFKGAWDERAQVFNDEMVKLADVVLCMRPEGIPGAGTDHEIELAKKLKKPVIEAPPGCNMEEVVNKINGGK